MKARMILALCALVCASACDEDTVATPDTGTQTDTGPGVDASVEDAESTDSGEDADSGVVSDAVSDTGPEDDTISEDATEDTIEQDTAQDATEDTGDTRIEEPPIFDGGYAELPDAPPLTFTDVESGVIAGESSTDPSDAHPGATEEEIVDADRIGDLAFVTAWNDEWGEYPPHDERYAQSNWPVTRLELSGFVTGPVAAYRIEPAQTAATEFVGDNNRLAYRFPEAVGQTVYEWVDGDLRQLVTLSASDVNAGEWTTLPELTTEIFDRERTLVFAPTSQRLTRLTRIDDAGGRGGRVVSDPVSDVVQVRIPLSGDPVDAIDRYNFGPGSFENQYGFRRAMFPVDSDAGAGIIWQDANSGDVFATWLSDDAPSEYRTASWPTTGGAALAAASSEGDGNYLLLFVESGDGEPFDTRTVTLVRTDAAGAELARTDLPAQSDRGLDIVEFNDSEHASIVRNGDRIAVHVTREMHRSDDGFNHQGAVVAVLDAETFAFVGPKFFADDENPAPMQTSSHTYTSTVIANDAGFVGAEIADGFPRGVMLWRIDEDNVMHHRVVYAIKTRHGEVPYYTEGGEEYPVYEDASRGDRTFYQWSYDTWIYSELAGVAHTEDGLVTVFAAERSHLDNGRMGELWNEPRELMMVRARADFERVDQAVENVVTDDLVLSEGATVEGEFYNEWGERQPARVAGVVQLTDMPENHSVTRPQLFDMDGRLLVTYEVWESERFINEWDEPEFRDTYIDTYVLFLNSDGTAAGDPLSLNRSVRIPSRDDLFPLAGGIATARADAASGELVVSIVLPGE